MKKPIWFLAVLLCSNIILSLALSGCGEADQENLPQTPEQNHEEPKTQVQDKQKTIDSSELGKNIKVNILGTDPEKYSIQFSWPTLKDGEILRIRLGSTLTEVQPSQTFFNHTVSHNQQLTYSFDVLDVNRALKQSFSKTVIVPFDYVVRKGDMCNISKETKIVANRVYLDPNCPFSTNGNDVSITTNELIAGEGFIQTFSENQKADPERSGRDGGNLIITARKLFGRLRVVMRGETGGRGTDGRAKDRAANGRSAYGGTTRITKCSKEVDVCAEVCDAQPVPALPGANGARGNPGGNGFAGGRTGNVRINIDQYLPSEGIDTKLPKENDQVIEVVQIPGPGGGGGNGGPGQLGGFGGVGLAGICKTPSASNGTDGPSGESGAKGPDGSMGEKCIYVGSENINVCN